ncbi:MAG TPA: VTT domain-containing protein [Lacipirellulaceae bacterium]|nr:VTT domain-containing protein [Lacipirellulaceae bacterium]
MHVILDFVLHLDAHLKALALQYGPWIYGLLFGIVFSETGLVITPFLPGDSLLFTCGALAATGILDIRVVAPLLALAAILGDTTNYSIGHFVGPRVFRAEDQKGVWHRILNRHHLLEAHAFFEKHGGKAVVLGQFMPIIRTFVPFVAGCGSMTYPRFAFCNLVAAVSWVTVCMGAGYAFGNVPAVKEHFELVVVGIVLVSLIPAAWGVLSSSIGRAATDVDGTVD